MGAAASSGRLWWRLRVRAKRVGRQQQGLGGCGEPGASRQACSADGAALGATGTEVPGRDVLVMQNLGGPLYAAESPCQLSHICDMAGYILAQNASKKQEMAGGRGSLAQPLAAGGVVPSSGCAHLHTRVGLRLDLRNIGASFADDAARGDVGYQELDLLRRDDRGYL